jgi:carboxyl-terminal processing protease
VFILLVFLLGGQTIFAQIIMKENNDSQSISTKRKSGLQMLDNIKDVIKQYYYDPTFHGINLDERFKTAKETVKTQETNSQIFRVIAQVLLDFRDSHTKFYPPARLTRVEYGFSMQTIGNECFITDIKKGSDAEAKGLKAGDQIIDIEDFAPNRDNLWVVEYVLYQLEPREAILLSVKGADGKNKKLEIKAKLKTVQDRKKEQENRKKEIEKLPFKCSELSSELIACKMYTFIIERNDVDKMMQQVGQHKKMILDLRGNGGGYLRSLAHLTGYFFDRDVKIGDEKLRDKTKELLAKTQKEKVYKGELIVLVDSDSASASEIFSGTIQLEKRGKIIGDVTAGAVMASYNIPMANQRGAEGFEVVSFYGMSVTIADFLLRDGKRLENIGVIPDVGIGPTSEGLLKKYDPVLSYSARIFGVEISQEKAGQLYFMADKPEQDTEEKDGKKEESN